MIFIYVFYLDVFLGQNFLMNLIILSLVERTCVRTFRQSILRRCLAAVLGAAEYAVFFLIVRRRIVFVLAGAFIVVPGMVLVSFGRQEGGAALFARRVMLGWLAAVILEGVAEAVYGMTGIPAWKIYAVGIAYFIAGYFLRRLRSTVNVAKKEFEVTLFWGKKSVKCLGLYDSGCLLTMPVSGEPVCIVSPGLLRKLSEGDMQEARTIPYNSLGTDCGLLRVYRLDQMKIQKKKGIKVLENPWVGQAQESIFAGKPYRVILNAGVIENE